MPVQLRSSTKLSGNNTSMETSPENSNHETNNNTKKTTALQPESRMTYVVFFGLIIDLSLQTYGAHTLASITVCYLRERIEKYSFGVNSILPLAMIRGTRLPNRLTYFFLIIFLHSLIYFSLIFFKFEFTLTIFLYTLINSIVNFIIIWIISKLIFDK